MDAFTAMMKPMQIRPTTKPKIRCRQCHATLELNDPGCIRQDCKIRSAGEYKIDPATGLYVPLEMGKKKKTKPTPMIKMDILPETNLKPREELVIATFKETNYNWNQNYNGQDPWYGAM